MPRLWPHTFSNFEVWTLVCSKVFRVSQVWSISGKKSLKLLVRFQDWHENNSTAHGKQQIGAT